METNIVQNHSRGYSVTGQITHKESQLGIPKLTVLLYDLGKEVVMPSNQPNTPVPSDLAPRLRVSTPLGNVITDAKGNFAFSFSEEDTLSITQGKRRLNLYIMVLAQEDEDTQPFSNVLYYSKTPRSNVGQQEHFQVSISSKTLAEKGVPVPKEETVQDRVQKFIRQRAQEEEFEKGVAGYRRQKREASKAQKAEAVKQFKKKMAPEPAGTAGAFMVKDGESITSVLDRAVQRGIANANKVLQIRSESDCKTSGVKVSLFLSEEQKDALRAAAPDNNGELFQITEAQLKEALQGEGESILVTLTGENPVEKYCIEKSAAAKCAIENLSDPNSANNNGQPESGPDGQALSPVKEEDILTNVQKMLVDMASPESLFDPEKPELPKRPNAAAVQDAVDKFSMKKGPAESPSYFDFHALEIAFPHVWQQVFDHSVLTTYEQVPLEDIGFDPGDLPLSGGNLPPSTAGCPVPPEVLAVFDISEKEYAMLHVDYQVKLAEYAGEIIKIQENKLEFQLNQEYVNRLLELSKIPELPQAPQGGNWLEQRLYNIILEQRQKLISEIRDIPLGHYEVKEGTAKRKLIRDYWERGEKIIEFVRNGKYTNLHTALEELDKKLSENYLFHIYAADKDTRSVNFGLMKTYRQKWDPVAYQVGDLVKTIPLAPKEEVKYSAKTVRNEKISRKEARKNNSTLHSEMSSTTRAEAEIVKKANAKTNFSYANEGGFDLGLGGSSNTSNFGIEAANESQDTKKDFREAVAKASQEFKEERSLEIDTETTYTSEYTQSGTIVNPNDELAVTYLFYELQRRFKVTEKIYRVMPVVLVAQEVPNQADITEAWLISHDWILNRFLLDDSFRPALQYLSSRNVGDDFAVRELRKNLRQQRRLVETLEVELSMREAEVNNRYTALENEIKGRIRVEERENSDGWLSDIGDAVFGGGQNPEAAKARELAANDAHRYAVEQAEKIGMALRQEVNNLHNITEAYNRKMEEHLNIETMVARLKTHVKNNILYYMQAIWSMEPPDQRYFRLYNVEVPVVETSEKRYTVRLTEEEDLFAPFRPAGVSKYSAWIQASLRQSNANKPLVEVADLDNLLGFKGNYMIFPLKEHNALTEIMAAPYVDEAFGAFDPDELGNVSLDDYSKYICCLHKELPAEEFNRLRPTLKKWLEKLLADPLRNGDEIIVPSGSLYIEMLPSSHTLLEDFKLKHRAMDVLKVQAEVRQMELENLRYAARLLAEERDDPRVEKKIVVEGNGVGVAFNSES